MTHRELVEKVKGWQYGLQRDYEQGCQICFRKRLPGLCEVFSRDPGVAKRPAPVRRNDLEFLPSVKAIVVGLDIREYTRRRPELQFFLTLNLHASIAKAISILRRASVVPPDEPRIVVQTGDGAFVVFTFLDRISPFHRDEWKRLARPDASRETEVDIVAGMREIEMEGLPELMRRALSFVFALNAITIGDNIRQGFLYDNGDLEEPTEGVFPTEFRYAMTYDDVIPLVDINGTLACVGSGLISCHRILSTDHGSHFLVQKSLLDLLNPYGGLAAIGAERWRQVLHVATLDEVRVKSGRFRYGDVFGFHGDGLLLRARGRTRTMPMSYPIGSHNVTSLDTTNE